MYVSVALTISASMALSAFAQAPENAFFQWKQVYQSAIELSHHHDFEQARSLLEKSWQTAENDQERGLAADGLGQTNRRLGRLTEAQTWLERSMEAFGSDPKQSLRYAVAAASLADLERSRGNYPGAEAALRTALRSDLCDPESRGFIRNGLADLLREQGRTAEAQPLFRESLAARDISARERIAALVGLADIDRQQNEWDSSISRWNEALETSLRTKDEAAEAIILRGLGLTWLQSGSAARAEPLLKKSLRLMDANPDLPEEEVAASHAAMAELYRVENKLALAEEEWTRALEIDRPVLGENHPQVAILMEMLAELWSVRGEFSRARDYSARASGVMSGAFGENSMAAAAALTNQAGVEQRAGDLSAAAAHFDRAVAIARTHLESGSAGIVMIERYAGLLKQMHRSAEAKAVLASRNALLSSDTTSFRVK